MIFANIEQIESSFRLLAPQSETLVDLFYARLFTEHPMLRSMFPSGGVDQQRQLLTFIELFVKNIRHPERLEEPLRELGIRLDAYGAKAEHDSIIKNVFLKTMQELGGPQWTSHYNETWSNAMDLIASKMLNIVPPIRIIRKAA